MNKNILAAGDPLKIFLEWYSDAQTGKKNRFRKNRVVSSGVNLFKKMLSAFFPWYNLFRPDIATLATVTSENRPSARSVLFRGLVEGGFSFYTDYESDKGKELEVNPAAVMVFYWHFPPRQVRIDGKVCKLSRKAAELDWKSRTRENQAASSAVRQSSIIRGREELIEKRNYAGMQVRNSGNAEGRWRINHQHEFRNFNGRRYAIHCICQLKRSCKHIDSLHCHTVWTTGHTLQRTYYWPCEDDRRKGSGSFTCTNP
ncbi:MAG: pyridoxamine 5'-phosphate oxidase family protein [Desulfobacterales bacterium]